MRGLGVERMHFDHYFIHVWPFEITPTMNFNN